MRILGFTKKWDKLNQPIFTTFRFPRRDKDWQLDEIVKVVFRPRSKDRETLGVARIVQKSLRKIGTAFEQYQPTEEEAKADGFPSLIEMNKWFSEIYGSRIFREPINKFTLRWVK